MFAHGETVTRQRAASVTDPYSGEATDLDWSLMTSLPIDGWGIDDSASSEPTQDARNAVVTDFVLYRSEPADVLPGDRVVVRGFVCNVVGRPAKWRNPMTGWDAGFVVRANIVEG